MPQTASKYQEVLKLLTEDSTSIQKFGSIKTILEGQNRKLDEILERCEKALGKIENLANGDIISLAADSLPAESEKEKKRKKAIILFIKYFKELKTEVERISKELDNKNSSQTNTFVKIFAFAKGPAGIITVVALLIAVALIATRNSGTKNNAPNTQTPQSTASPKQKIEIINFNGKKLPLTELRIGTGPDCDSPHYHAKNEISVKSTDGSPISDPGGCGFGKLKDTPTQQIEI